MSHFLVLSSNSDMSLKIKRLIKGFTFMEKVSIFESADEIPELLGDELLIFDGDEKSFLYYAEKFAKTSSSLIGFSEKGGISLGSYEIYSKKKLGISLLNFIKKEKYDKENLDYIAFDISFLALGLAHVNFYLKKTEKKFELILKKGTQISKEKLDSLKTSKTTLYIKTNDFYNESNELFLTQIVERVGSIEKKSFDLKVVANLCHSLNIPEGEINEANRYCKNFIEKLKEGGSPLYRKVEELFHRTILNHSYLIAVFSLYTSKKYDWMTTDMRENLFIAGLLHDIGIEANNKCESLEFIDNDNCTENKEHIVKAINILKKEHLIDEEVIKIINFHHHLNSFPYQRSSEYFQIDRLSAHFSLVHYFLMKAKSSLFKKEKIKKILEEMKIQLSSPIYKNIVTVFCDECFLLFEHNK